MESREAIPRRPSLATRKVVYEVLLTRSPSPFGRRLSLTGGESWFMSSHGQTKKPPEFKKNSKRLCHENAMLCIVF
jgi:hypothetical protein